MFSRRFFITFNSFLAVLACYLLYGWAAVPLLMPKRQAVERPVEIFGGNENRDSYAQFFPKDYWEHDQKSSRVLRTGDTVIMFQEWERLDDNTRIKVHPCTILLLQGDPELPKEERQRQAIVIRTLDHALLDLDGEFDFSDTRNLNIKKGTLVGDVTFFSDMKETGPADDLHIKGRDITFSETPAATTISSIHEVDLLLGPNRCVGSKLNIVLDVANPKKPTGPKTLSTVELIEMKSLRLISSGKQSGDAEENESAEMTDPTIIDVTCKRDFVLYKDKKAATDWIARFRDDVFVICNNPDGTKDTIDCGELQIRLRPRPSDAKKQQPVKLNDQIAAGNYEIASIRALWKPEVAARPGSPGRSAIPARLESPSHDDFVAEGEEILYDLVRNNIQIFKTRRELPPVRLTCRQKTFYLEAQKITYAPGKNEEFGILTAVGGGTMRGLLGSVEKPQKFTCSWKTLDIRQDSKNHDQLLIRLDRDIRADLENTGKMTADSAYFWCFYRPKKETASADEPASTAAQVVGSDVASNVDIILDRGQILGNVLQFQTEEGTCKAKQMDLFFRDADTTSEPSFQSAVPIRRVKYQHPVPPPPTGMAVSPMPPVQAQPMMPLGSAANVPNTVPAIPTASGRERGFLFGSRKDGSADSTFDIAGEQIQLYIVNLPEGSEVERFDIYGNVSIREKILHGDTSQAISITGKEIHVREPGLKKGSEGRSNTEIRVVGEAPNYAEFNGKGVRLIGANINISRASNLLWVDGGGRLIVDVPVDENGNTGLNAQMSFDRQPATAAPPMPGGAARSIEKLLVNWNQGMKFDGNMLLFKGKMDQQGHMVDVFFQYNRISSETLYLYLNRSFSFFDDRSTDDLKAETIDCHGDVWIQSYRYEGQVQQSRDEAQCERLQIHVPSSDFKAVGPGRISSTYLASASSSMMPTMPDPAADASSSGLRHVDITFHDQVTGNFQQRDATLYGQIYCIVSQVSSWEEKIDTDSLSEVTKRGILMQCNQLHVMQSAGVEPNVEIVATKNTRIDGNGYYAKAESFKYNQAKNRVILEGNSTSDANLYTDRGSVQGKRIAYDIATGAYDTSGLRIY